MGTVPMLAPDGTPGDIPQERAAEAIKAGFSIGTDMQSPDGKLGVIPLSRVHDAIHAGFLLKGAEPQAPANPIEQDSNDPRKAAFSNRIPGSFEGSYSSGDTGYGAAMTGAGLAGAGALIPGVRTAVSAGVKAVPYVAAAEGINYARQNLPGGKYIPPGSELLPFFMIGQGGKRGKPTPSEQPTGPRYGPPEMVDAKLPPVRYGPTYQEPPVYPGAPLPANPGIFPGAPQPTAPSQELLQSRTLVNGPAPVSPAQTGEALSNLPVPRQSQPPQHYPGPGEIPPLATRPRAYYGGVQPEPIPQRSGLALPPAPESPAAQVRTKLGLEPPNAVSSWPPDEEMPFPNPKTPHTKAEILDDQAVQQESRDWLERSGQRAQHQESQRAWAANSPAVPKGVLVEEAGGTVPEHPVKYTKTPSPKAKVSATPQDPENLLELLKQSVRQAQLRKAVGARK